MTQQVSDAIQFYLEHVESYSAEVFLPYSTGEDGQVVFGQIFAQEGGHEVFFRRP